MKSRNLKFISFNCTGFKPRIYEYIKELYYKCDVLLVQETWLFNFQHSSIENSLCGSQYHAVSPMDESAVCRVGQPCGGCAIMRHHSLALAFHPVPTRSPCLCAVAHNSDSDKHLLSPLYACQ